MCLNYSMLAFFLLCWLCCCCKTHCKTLQNVTYREYKNRTLPPPPLFGLDDLLFQIKGRASIYILMLLPKIFILNCPLFPVTFSLGSVCPQLRPDAYTSYSENDVYRSPPPETSRKIKDIRLGLGVASLLDDTLNSSVFPSSNYPASIDCSFQVSTGPESRGIFVVLSQLSALRRWSNGSCQDYLQINYANFYSAAICGPIGQDGESILSFDSNIGVVKVLLHLDNSAEGSGIRKEFQMRLKLIMTSYFDCAKERSGFSCTSTNERCIPSEYVNDGLVNCDVPNCRDEGSCTNRGEESSSGKKGIDSLSITILIGLVSFSTTGLLFGLLLWFCLKKNFKQRLNATASNPDMELSNVYGPEQGGSGSRQRRTGAEMAGGSSTEQGGPSPSADPPPSYDILFPDK